VIEEEALVIQQTVNQPEEVMKAQEFLRKAGAAEKNNDFEQAVQLYESAAGLWPTNGKIQNRLATLYLVNLGMNAKAIHYAKESLKLDPADTKASLYAAIASANMQRMEEASEYFTQSISGNPPMKEALVSFAAFNENNHQYEAALKVLEKFNSHYGETIDTMVSKARLLDKIGKSEQAIVQYKAILASGFALQPDLKKYIMGRVAASN
jgi:type IV pilus assembly protein PilQ